VLTGLGTTARKISMLPENNSCNLAPRISHDNSCGTIVVHVDFNDPMSRFNKNAVLILVVEDEALVRACTAALLEDAGCSVIEAGNAEEALREFETHALITTLFTDINMPGAINGLSLAHKIFQMRPQVQLILTSGRGLPREGEMPAGGQFLPKPYDCEQLTEMIRAA
jgi:CheY-like chemotaxis protein